MNCDILIIDDDEDDVDILSGAFTQASVKCVHYVHTVMQAFIYLQQVASEEDPPKLIVTDYYLLGITGEQFVADLKAMPLYKQYRLLSYPQ